MTISDKHKRINDPENYKIALDRDIQLGELLARIFAEIISPAESATLQFTVLNKIEFDPVWIDRLPSSKERLFAVVDLLNSRSLMSDDVDVAEYSECKLLIQLNTIASRQARSKNAYSLALKYAQIALKLLDNIGGQQEYDLTIAVSECAIDAAAGCGEFALMDRWIERSISAIPKPVALVGICVIKIQSLSDRDLPLAAVRLGRSMLAQFGVQLPLSPTLEDVDRVIRAIDDLMPNAALPLMTDPDRLAIVRVAASMMSACYAVDLNLYALVVGLQVELSLQAGINPSSAASYAAYAIFIANYRQRVASAQQFSSWAYELAIVSNTQQMRSKTLAAIGLFLTHRTTHLRDTIPIFQAGYHAALATGNSADLSYNFAGLVAVAYWCGESLPTLATQLIDASESSELTDIYASSVTFLLGNSVDPDRLDRVFEPPDRQNSEQIFAVYFHRAVLGLLMGDLPQATVASLQAREWLNAVGGSIYEVNYYCSDSLIALAVATEVPARVLANQHQLAQWAKFAPMNYLHKWQLVAAEIYRVSNDKAAAIEFYDLAIAGALAHDFIQEAALANELAAKFYFAWDKAKLGTEYLQAADRYYAQWGATAKRQALTRTYPQLSIEMAAPTEAAEREKIAPAVASWPFDFAAYVRAIEALSSEIDIDRLLHKLMDVVVEHAGADKAALLLSRDGNLTIALEYDGSELDTLDFDLHSFDRDNRLPLYLIRNVHHTQKLEIYHRDRHPYLTQDPYFEEYQPDSILCVPILNQSKAIGILYLENSTTTEAFTSDRVELLNIICTQAAISLENARLHQETQAYAQRLERSLRDLQSSEARLHKVADNIPGVIAQVWIAPDRDRETLRYISSGCYELYELTAAEILDRQYSLRYFEHPEDRPQIDRLVHQSRQQLAPIQLEYRIVTASGKVKWIYVAASSLEPQPDGSFLVECTILDISARQIALQERQQFEQQLQITNAELLHSNRLKDRFIANMSHELRTPLNAILGMTVGLNEGVFGEINPEQSSAIETIASSGEQLLALINDVFELAKIDSGQLELRCLPTAIVPLCESSLASIRQQAAHKQIHINVRFQPNLPTLSLDERRIRQVLINLLNNAVKFTPAGGQIDLEVAYLTAPDFLEPQMQVSLTQPLEPRVRITISDTGIGISPDNIKKLFQPFIQIDGDLNRQFEGTGLGLVLVKRIVDLHGGKVALSSELGLGSSFIVDLPCHDLSAPWSDVAGKSPQLQIPAVLVHPSARPPLILLAEDNEANIHTLSSYLRAKGYQIVLASGGDRAAIDLARSTPPDIILMDIQLPIVDGLSAIGQIREFSNVPIIVMTALTSLDDITTATSSDRQTCLAAGASEYLTKPVKLKQLTMTIQQLLTAAPQLTSIS